MQKYFSSLFKEIWPKKRNIIYRPDRLKYVKRARLFNSCVFCEVFKKPLDVNSLCLYKEEGLGAIMLNKFPYNTGHLLICPQTHTGDLEKLDEASLKFLYNSIAKSTGILKKVFQCEGFNVGLNLGKVAGSSIPDHIHFHVVPRWLGDTNFFPLIGETKVLPETLESVYNKLKPHF